MRKILLSYETWINRNETLRVKDGVKKIEYIHNIKSALMFSHDLFLPSDSNYLRFEKKAYNIKWKEMEM